MQAEPLRVWIDAGPFSFESAGQQRQWQFGLRACVAGALRCVSSLHAYDPCWSAYASNCGCPIPHTHPYCAATTFYQVFDADMRSAQPDVWAIVRGTYVCITAMMAMPMAMMSGNKNGNSEQDERTRWRMM